MFIRYNRPVRRKKSGPTKKNISLSETSDLSDNLDENLVQIKEILADFSDLVIKKFKIAGKQQVAAIIYIDGLIDTTTLYNCILHPLMLEAPLVEALEGHSEGLRLRDIKEHILLPGQLSETTNMYKLIDFILAGNVALLLHRTPLALIADIRGWEARSRGVEESPSETVVQGPREAFNETLRTNTSLLRRRIRNPGLKVEILTLGRQTKTDIALTYIQHLAQAELVDEVKKRLQRIDTDAILDANYVLELIEDYPLSPFPTISSTERPDSLAAKLLEGRVGIMVDGSPVALTVPTLFLELFQDPEDYYTRSPLSTFSRWLRLLGAIIALGLPSFYVALTTFHQEMIPTTLLVRLAAAREGVPFPIFLEVLVMEISFEIFREAGVRMPRPLGPAVSIVGGLVLGDAAITAGLASPATVLVVASMAVASLTVGYAPLIGALRIFRFPFLLMAASFGFIGLVISYMLLHAYLVSLQSFGVPYMSPLAPMASGDLKDILIRAPLRALRIKPQSIRDGKPVR